MAGIGRRVAQNFSSTEHFVQANIANITRTQHTDLKKMQILRSLRVYFWAKAAAKQQPF